MASSRVNRSTNVKLRDEDINQKLQLYGIASAFKLGKLPSNDQIDTALNSFLASKALSNPSGKLSPEGRALVSDFREVVSRAKYLVLSKNHGNLLQDFIWQTSSFDYKTIDLPGSSLTKDAAKLDGEKTLQGLKTLGNLLITNGQFRKLLKDASILLRDVAADGATKAASKVRPGEDALAQIDAPAEDNTWHTTPTFSKEELKNQTRGFYKKSTKTTEGSDAVSDPVDSTAYEDSDNFKRFAKTKYDDYRTRTKEYFDKKVPQERRDLVVLRLKKMVLECQQHSDYQTAIQTLLDLAEKYNGHARVAGTGAAGVVQNTRSRMDKAENDLKTLIERFANGTSTDNLWESISTMYKQADKDPELKTWFKDASRFLRRSLQEKDYVLENEAAEEWKRLYDRGRYLLQEKYKSSTTRIVDEVRFLADQFDKDEQNKAFGNTIKKLFNDLGNDENGKPTFKPHLVKDLTSVIIPAALESLSYIPIPRIEYSDPQLDAVIENLVIESDNLMPNMLEIYNSNHVSWGRKMAKVGKNKHSVQVKVAGIQMDLRNVSYYVKKKQGFPSLTDVGIFSVLMAGSGFSFQLGLSTADNKDKQHFFKVDKVSVDIDYLKIKVHKSRHKILFSLFKPIAMRVLRPVLQKVAEKAIRDNFDKLDAAAYDIKQEADRAGVKSKADPDSATPNSYKRFYDAAQKRVVDGKQKKKAAAANKSDSKKINYAFTKEDSIFPNIQLPGGFSIKATEYKEMARKGETWQSPVFAIGKASQSKDIPGPPKVERKKAAVINGNSADKTKSESNGINASGAFAANPSAADSATTSGVGGATSGVAAIATSVVNTAKETASGLASRVTGA